MLDINAVRINQIFKVYLSGRSIDSLLRKLMTNVRLVVGMGSVSETLTIEFQTVGHL